MATRKKGRGRLCLDNAELFEAAELLELRSKLAKRAGDHDTAGASFDAARAFRRVARAARKGKHRHDGFRAVLVPVRFTTER